MAQLLNARLFPCTFKDIKSAITFNALKQFQIHHLESKVVAMDYCGSLRRLTDNAFTASVLDMYENFLRCSHWWGVLTTRIRLGQEHGIDKLLVNHPIGNTVLYCPSCPEPGFNMDLKMPNKLSPELRHLRQQRDTLDGNFHCTKSSKNSDPKSYLLYKGSGFFPTNTVLKDHLAQAPATVEVTPGAKIDACGSHMR
ncbi:CxC2 domain-containing protein [Mycena venus]|uniref:CxC2 domain-containing protein n=1 Tax=Mycena venus TaxID=2733690 RepID=A0A8H6XJD8_9AGAR|nr:CxC2 domain-containing protein [Mycena venus]